MGPLMNLTGQRRLIIIVAPLVAVVVVLGGAGTALWANSEGAKAAASYHAQRAVLDGQLKAADAQGYCRFRENGKI